MNEEEQLNLKDIENELWDEAARRTGTERAKALTALSRIAWDKNKYEDSLALCQSARNLYLEADKEIYAEHLADVNLGIMNSFDMLNQPKEAAQTARLVIDFYRRTDHPQLGELLRDQGIWWFASGDFQNSLESHLEAISIIDLNQSEIAKGIDYLNIAMARNRFGQFEESIADLKSALAIFKQAKDPKWVAKCQAELAEVFFKLEQWEESEFWSRKAVDYANLISDAQLAHKLNYQIAVSLSKKGDFHPALSVLAKARYQVVYFDSDNWDALVRIEKEIASTNSIIGNTDEAEEILRRLATIEETLNSK